MHGSEAPSKAGDAVNAVALQVVCLLDLSSLGDIGGGDVLSRGDTPLSSQGAHRACCWHYDQAVIRNTIPA